MKLTYVIALLFVLGGCAGYKFGHGEILSQYDSISVPYVAGDVDGALTAILVKEISSRSTLCYKRDSGALRLEVELFDLRDQNVGFRYDRKKKGELTKSVIPTETRAIATAEIRLIEVCSGTVILGPVMLSASVDFDHDYYSSRNGVNIFSLGQLSDVDAAYDAVKPPLYRALAQKIVDFILDGW